MIRHFNVGDLKTYKDGQRFIQSTEGKLIHLTTVRRNLIQEGVRTYSQPNKPKLTRDQMAKRLQFAKEHIHWTVDDWKKVMFSDETMISRVGSFGKSYYHCKPEHRAFHHHQIKPTLQGGGGKMMLWGCITFFGVGDAGWLHERITADVYLDAVRDYIRKSRDYWRMDPKTFIFQQDNARVHTAHTVMEFFKKNNITVLPWPANSPDLNPIEYVWAFMKQRLDHHPKELNDLNELWEHVQDIWTHIPDDFLHKLYESMPKRLEEVIKNKGRNTKY